MNDTDFVAALHEVFDANDPSDGIDRSEGYGRDHQIESVRIVESDDGFDDLEVTIRTDRKVVTARVLFDSDWRAASGLDQVDAYAAYVVAMLSTEVVAGPGLVRSGSGGADDVEVALKRGSTDVARTAPDVVTAVGSDGEPFSVHVSAQEWRGFVASHGDAAVSALEATITSRWDDESHVVYFRGTFHPSIRAELPPVRSMVLREPHEDDTGSPPTTER